MCKRITGNQQISDYNQAFRLQYLIQQSTAQNKSGWLSTFRLCLVTILPTYCQSVNWGYLNIHISKFCRMPIFRIDNIPYYIIHLNAYINKIPSRQMIVAPSSELLKKQISPYATIKKAHLNSIETIAAHPNGLEVATGGHDKLIKIWDTSKGSPLNTLEGHKQSNNTNIPHIHRQGIWSLSYSPDGKDLLSGSCDSTLIIWDVKKAKPAKILQGHKNKIYWAKYNENGSMVASGGQSSPIIIWDMRTGGILKSIPNQSQVVYCVEWSKDGKYLASTQMDGTLNLYQTKNFELVAHAQGDAPSKNRAYGCDLDFTQMPGSVYVATEDRYVKEFYFTPETKGLELKSTHFAHYDAVKSLTLHAKKRLLISTGRDGSVRLWNVKDHHFVPLASLVGHQDNVSKAVFVPSNSEQDVVVASGSWDESVNFWRVKV